MIRVQGFKRRRKYTDFTCELILELPPDIVALQSPVEAEEDEHVESTAEAEEEAADDARCGDAAAADEAAEVMADGMLDEDEAAPNVVLFVAERRLAW